jgi:hypothetical protein
MLKSDLIYEGIDHSFPANHQNDCKNYLIIIFFRVVLIQQYLLAFYDPKEIRVFLILDFSFACSINSLYYLNSAN